MAEYTVVSHYYNITGMGNIYHNIHTAVINVNSSLRSKDNGGR